jgi:hypothetical protein
MQSAAESSKPEVELWTNLTTGRYDHFQSLPLIHDDREPTRARQIVSGDALHQPISGLNIEALTANYDPQTTDRTPA